MYDKVRSSRMKESDYQLLIEEFGSFRAAIAYLVALIKEKYKDKSKR